VSGRRHYLTRRRNPTACNRIKKQEERKAINASE